ncbi:MULTISPECIES: DUF177 domain-containing protein [unclassified Variovorax]|uniref:YceD family protein n=1 Tax=unclassified Variovorax TaxID=663243 RepID=UPI00076DDC58|nr:MULTISPECIES: DUF177 domain-containing protein [unclassified Variovorax]KWT90207.1 hypothetical protein APY03_3301 [Variovorax sp. WDL1]
MSREFTSGRLDVNRFAEAAATLSGEEPLQAYPRLGEELAAPAADSRVRWKAVGTQRDGHADATVPWLHLSASSTVPLVCQRCLTPVDVELKVDRWFRFVADEGTAAVEDEESEEDVLVASRDFNLHALIEDELLMEIPVTPRHEHCPEPVRLSAADPEFDAAEATRPNPFAVLGGLRSDKRK